jgi:[acyl-carrier-protein] S-malonyltransferase
MGCCHVDPCEQPVGCRYQENQTNATVVRKARHTMSIAFLFPGQGAQAVGMGKDLCESYPSAKAIFDQAQAETGLELKKLCFEGPEEELSRTDIAQPAIFTVSAAMLAAMHEVLGDDGIERIRPSWLAGLSLGEYTALYAADALDFGEMVKLVARRGELMQQAAMATPSGMVSVIGLDEQKATELCEAASEGQILTCANFNCPGQIVLSGEKHACKRAAEQAEQFGAKGAIELKVAGAFHSEIMRPAVAKFEKALQAVTFRDLKTPVVSNVDAKPYTSADAIRQKLLDQLVSPVRWEASMVELKAQGAEKFFEIGPGRVLAGLMRRIERRADFTSVNSQQAVEKLSQ